MRLRQHRRSAQLPLPVELAGLPWRPADGVRVRPNQEHVAGASQVAPPRSEPARIVGELAMMLEQRIPRVVHGQGRVGQRIGTGSRGKHCGE